MNQSPASASLGEFMVHAPATGVSSSRFYMQPNLCSADYMASLSKAKVKISTVTQIGYYLLLLPESALVP